jgi:hypothetical protein
MGASSVAVGDAAQASSATKAGEKEEGSLRLSTLLYLLIISHHQLIRVFRDLRSSQASMKKAAVAQSFALL